jgi:RNA polymerase sigma-70 factor (ECF subfamily)
LQAEPVASENETARIVITPCLMTDPSCARAQRDSPIANRCILAAKGLRRMDPAELLALVAGGETDAALDRLHADHGADLQRFVAAKLGDSQSVEDICQDVWAAVQRALPRFEGRATPRVWILRIARNKLVDRLRHGRGFATLDTSAQGGGPLAAALGLAPTTPTEELARRQRIEALGRALERLDADDRELLELRFVVGLRPAEIIDVLELDERANTVSQRLVRIVQRVRRELLEAHAP